MTLNIALAGNPNAGKSTLFNLLTGSEQYVGNWPGVTVEKKTGKYLKDSSINLIDLPGVYSLTPYSMEEVVTKEYLFEEVPD
ncbi:MAG: ferrous iron transporter B, partial [Gallicola sp.]|nr:ferrous iron transporter B [Gallicola sp.]